MVRSWRAMGALIDYHRLPQTTIEYHEATHYLPMAWTICTSSSSDISLSTRVPYTSHECINWYGHRWVDNSILYCCICALSLSRSRKTDNPPSSSPSPPSSFPLFSLLSLFSLFSQFTPKYPQDPRLKLSLIFCFLSLLCYLLTATARLA